MVKYSLQSAVFLTIALASGCSSQKCKRDHEEKEILYISVFGSSPMPLLDLVTIGFPKRNGENTWIATLNNEQNTEIEFSGFWIASPAYETEMLFMEMNAN